MIAGDTPEELLTEVAHAQALNPALGIHGVFYLPRWRQRSGLLKSIPGQE
jgi:hypothetical protein